MGKLPAYLHYAKDWLTDTNLSLCSKAAKGVWQDILDVMFLNIVRGVACYADGTPWTDEELSRAIGGDITENVNCIRELLAKGVAHRNQRGAIFSRRMVADEKERQANRDRVKKHRNAKCNDDVMPDVMPLSGTANGDGIEVLKLSSKPQAQKPKKQEFILPDWVPREAWEGFEEMRRKISKPMTERARKIALGKLAELKSEGHSPELVLNQSVMNDYQGLWPVKGNGNGGLNQTQQTAVVASKQAARVASNRANILAAFGLAGGAVSRPGGSERETPDNRTRSATVEGEIVESGTERH